MTRGAKQKQTAAVRMKLQFTDAERRVIEYAAQSVWNEIGYDCLNALAQDAFSGSEIAGDDAVDRVTMTRADVIEVVCDAGRLEAEIRRKDRALAERVGTLGEELYELLKPAFQSARYGT